MKAKKYLSWLYVAPILIYFLLIWALVYVEKDAPGANITSLWDGLWYSVVTLTTVGYGDYYPVTSVGKVLGLSLIFASLGLLGFLIGNLTNRIRTYMDKKRQGFYGTNFTNHFVIINWNQFGRQVTDQIITVSYTHLRAHET